MLRFLSPTDLRLDLHRMTLGLWSGPPRIEDYHYRVPMQIGRRLNVSNDVIRLRRPVTPWAEGEARSIQRWNPGSRPKAVIAVS